MVKAAILALALLVAPGCAGPMGSISWSDVTDLFRPAPKPPVEVAYVVTEGQREERKLTVPCGVSFDITGARPGIADGGPEDNKTFAWAFEKSFRGGNSNPENGFTAVARSYKLKVYDRFGAVAKEKSYPDAWDPALTYHVDFRVTAEEATFTVTQAGAVVAQAVTAAAAPEAVTVGIGWPVGRPGMKDAKLTGIAWEGATP